MDITDYIISALKWLIKWFFKLIWMGIKAILGAAKEEASNKPSPSVTPASAASSSRVAKEKPMERGFFDYRIPTNWTATYYYRGEHIRVTLHHHKTQPAEFEFLNELRKMRGGRINISEVRLMSVVQG